jgi:glyoxylase-like metal-dependent hydrolase (beta-lactamase superfamily II)
MFNADLGSARADFPGGDAKTLFLSGKKLLQLPEHVKIWSGHDYPPEDQKGRLPWMTVRDQREKNKHLKTGIEVDDFVTLRQQRDASLAEPRLLNQALQINIRAGRLPSPSAAGLRVIQMPLKLDDCTW